MRVLSVVSLLLSALYLLSLTSPASAQNVTGFATCNFTTMQLTLDGRSGVAQMSGWLSINLTAGAYTVPNTPGFAGRTYQSYPIVAMYGQRRLYNVSATPTLTTNNIVGIGANRTIYLTFDPTQGAAGYPTDPGFIYRFDYTGINILTDSATLPVVTFAEVNVNPSNQYSELDLFVTGLWSNASFGLSSCVANYTFTNVVTVPANQTNAANTSRAVGDPAFTGFLGQHYQIHGMADTVYALISDATLQLNARFVFLAEGQCPIVHSRPLTNCWSHPGSYFGQLALHTADDTQLLITAGSHTAGFTATLNGRPLVDGQSVQTAQLNVTVVDRFRLRVETGVYKLSVENSDMFVNIASIAVRDWSRLVAEVQPHGLLGQTWQSRGKRVIEGEVDDYAEAKNELFGSAFLYSKFGSK